MQTFNDPWSAIFLTSLPPQKAPAGTYNPCSNSYAFAFSLFSSSSSARAVGEPIFGYRVTSYFIYQKSLPIKVLDKILRSKLLFPEFDYVVCR